MTVEETGPVTGLPYTPHQCTRPRREWPPCPECVGLNKKQQSGAVAWLQGLKGPQVIDVETGEILGVAVWKPNVEGYQGKLPL